MRNSANCMFARISVRFSRTMRGMTDIAPLNLLSSLAVLDQSLEGWTLLDRPSDLENRRIFRQEVAFERSFSSPPLVQVALVGLDVSNEANLRIRVKACDIKANGFSLVAETWWDTRIWSVEVSWLAVGV